MLTAASVPLALALHETAPTAWTDGLTSVKVGLFAKEVAEHLKMALRVDKSLGPCAKKGIGHLRERLLGLEAVVTLDKKKKHNAKGWLAKVKKMKKFLPLLRPYASGGASLDSSSDSEADLDDDGDDPRKPAAAGPTTPRSKKPRQALTPRHT